jgi:hypothetical protein
MCVCISKGLTNLQMVQFFNFRAGGASSPSSLAPTKTLGHWTSAGDIWPDQSDLPAMVPFRIFEFRDSVTAATVLNWSF